LNWVYAEGLRPPRIIPAQFVEPAALSKLGLNAPLTPARRARGAFLFPTPPLTDGKGIETFTAYPTDI